MKIQSTKKNDCHAHITIKHCKVYPEFKVTCSGKENLRSSKERKMVELKRVLSTDKEKVKTQDRYFISLPTEETHSCHLTGKGLAGLGQRVHPKVASKISELVGEGITDLVHTYTIIESTMIIMICARKALPILMIELIFLWMCTFVTT